MKPDYSSNTQQFAWITISILVLTICSIGANYSFITYLSFEKLKHQSYYLIDAYYYHHLGKLIVNDISLGYPFWEAVLSYTPNFSSVGVVAISTMLSFFFESIFITNIIFGFIYIIVTYKILKKLSVNKLLFILSYVALLPYLFVVSKESLLLIAYFNLVLAIYSQSLSTRFLYLTVFLILSIFSRPEFILICLLSYLVLRMIVSKKRFLYFFLILPVMFLSPLIDYINNISFAFQVSAMEVGTGQCDLFLFDVCIELDEYNVNEYASRFVLYFAFPIKWAIDLISFLFLETFFAYAFVIKFCYFLSTITFIYLAVLLPRFNFDCRKLYLLLIPFVYMLTYSTLFFFQGARQFSVVIMLTAIALSINVKGRGV